MAKHNDEELNKILNDANKAKEELHKVVQKLYKSHALMQARPVTTPDKCRVEHTQDHIGGTWE